MAAITLPTTTKPPQPCMKRLTPSTNTVSNGSSLPFSWRLLKIGSNCGTKKMISRLSTTRPTIDRNTG
jgi:hypothetical protein